MWVQIAAGIFVGEALLGVSAAVVAVIADWWNR